MSTTLAGIAMLGAARLMGHPPVRRAYNTIITAREARIILRLLPARKTLTRDQDDVIKRLIKLVNDHQIFETYDDEGEVIR